MEEPTKRKARTRRRNFLSLKENLEKEFEKAIENVECETQNSETLPSDHKFEISIPKSDLDKMSVEDINISGFISSKTDSSLLENLTYSISKNSETEHHTYTLKEPEDPEVTPPVPAPRKRKPKTEELEKVSSDTDKDVIEIEIDEIAIKSDQSESLNSATTKPKTSTFLQNSTKSESVMVPVPKPRNINTNFHYVDGKNQMKDKPKPKSMENLTTLTDDINERNIKSDPDLDFKIPLESMEPLEFPETVETKKEKEFEKSEKKVKKQKKINLSGILDMKKKKSKDKKTNRKKTEEETIPSISSSLKDLKESGQSDTKEKSDDDKSDFLTDSPPHTAPVQNGKIYVQSSNGFYIVDREVLLKNENFGLDNMDNEREMEDSTVKTAIWFQKYWSRFMVYFHGLLAGFAFSHAATVTGLMLLYNYEPIDFINIYSCLSLKIHFTFYTLTTLCLISCFDRIDIGHMNFKHWQVAWKTPSIWLVLTLYLLSFLLTFANQKTEARFDSHYSGNETHEQIWQTEVKIDIHVGVLTWYHTIWIRDMLLLIAWFIISITEFPDFMSNHLNNMAKYIRIKN